MVNDAEKYKCMWFVDLFLLCLISFF
jgi:hypothetical protein